MQTFARVVLATTALILLTWSARAQSPVLVETAVLADKIKAGEMPPVADRVPAEPAMAVFDTKGTSIGKPGGTLDMLIEKPQDIKRMSAFGFTRLIGYDRQYTLQPDLLKAFEVVEGRIFTFHLRKGHKWSDGEPFTTADLLYYWNDMALNAELSPAGPPREMLVDGKLPLVEAVDDVTIRYTWDQPNPFFLPAIANATPLMIYRPKHYLKKYHKAYAKPEKLEAEIKKRNRRDWVDLHFNRDRSSRLDNPSMPTLDPWMNITDKAVERIVFARNPFFHWIDAQGRQLPYLDAIALQVAASDLIPLKVETGEADLQFRGLKFSNYTVLKGGEQRHGYDVRLWRQARGSQVALYPNLNANDTVWRGLMRDVRFRRALSLAINRQELNEALYFGLARESGNTLLPDSPMFDTTRAAQWSNFDLPAANALLNEMGLTGRDSRGLRLLPDGRPLEIIVETAGEGSEQADVLELIRDSWREIGVGLFSKPQTRELLRRRVTTGEAVMSVFYGFDNGIANANFAPSELAPTNEDQLNWSQFGLWYVSTGKSGKKPDMPEVQKLVDLYQQWSHAADIATKTRIWNEMLSINADQVFTIGTINSVPQPVVVSRKLHNVPEAALYAWEPGGELGLYRPDTFWLSE
jgi:peptide/nickel transport system substrate-binding protein